MVKRAVRPDAEGEGAERSIVHCRFVNRPESVPAARRFVASCLARHLVGEETAWTAALLVSELATNAVEHARTAFGVTVELTRRSVLVEVTDGTRQLPTAGYPAPDALRGRGMVIVGELAPRWGAEALDQGPTAKRVWFELPLDA